MDLHYLPCLIGFPLGNLTGYIFWIKRAQFLRNSLDEASDSSNVGRSSSVSAFFSVHATYLSENPNGKYLMKIIVDKRYSADKLTFRSAALNRNLLTPPSLRQSVSPQAAFFMRFKS